MAAGPSMVVMWPDTSAKTLRWRKSPVAMALSLWQLLQKYPAGLFLGEM